MSNIAIRDLNEIKKLDHTDMYGIHGGHGDHYSIGGSCGGGSGGENRNPDDIMFEGSQQPAVAMVISSQIRDLATTPPVEIPSSSGRAKPVLKSPPRCPGAWVTL